MNCGPNPDKNMETSMGSDAQLMLPEPSFVEEDNLSAIDHDDTLVIAFEEIEEHTSTPEAEETTQNTKHTPSENLLGLNLDSQSDRAPPAKIVQPKPKKQVKAARAGKKYVPSKKAMTDPLKIDLSKPLATPLTSSQISLQCIECHIIFSDHKSKERHLKASHPAEYEQSILRNALFACYVCDRHFTNSTELMAHQKTHIEKNPFKCPICAQTFGKLSELSVHKKVHFGQHGYTCTQCGKPCKTLTLLKYHCRTHTGERPYVCKECGKRFSMPKALQKHLESHLPEGAQPKKEGAPLSVYTCSICKSTFKSTKTRHYHMKKKHNISKSALTKTSGNLVRQCTPIITPISISQPSLLQVGPNGPLQKVDANIDTEQLRKLIESLGNIQKVNQVVILGQVPPDAPPLEVQRMAQPLSLNMGMPQVDFMGMNSKTNDTIVDPMEQTIILEPITPDGQLLNPPFSALESNLGDNPVAEVIFPQPMDTEQPLQTDEIVCHGNVLGQNLAPALDQTIVLELTPALTPTAELEQSENVLQSDIPPSTFTQNNNLVIPLVQPSISEHETSMSVQSLLSTVELEMLPIQTDQHIGPVCSFSPQETLPEYQTETITQDGPDSLMPTNCVEPNVQKVTEEEDKRIEQADEATTEQMVTDEPKIMNVEKMDNHDEENKEGKVVNTQVKENQVEQPTEMPINVMSAQELVKVRKRKPPKAFFLQEYMHEFVSSVYDDFPSKTAKCKKAKKSHLVVKFGPPNKGKQSKKTSKSSKQPTKEDSKAKSPSQGQRKIQKKGRKDKKATSSDITAEIEVPASSEENDQASKQKEGKNKKKKQKAGTKKTEKHIGVASPVFKKKQKKIIQSKDVKEKITKNKRKTLGKTKGKATPQKTESADKSISHIQESLLLLKGHKQPQLKVHKLDPLQAQEVLLSETQTSPKEKDSPANPASKGITTENKKKGGRSKKALTLLSSLQTSKKQEVTPPKPKATRKRKASSKVETEGVITSKKAIECKDCGQRFSDVLLLQNHKATVHIVESPGITFTNGNLFEGVTQIDLYQLPKQVSKDAISLNTGWDTEPEMAELDRERCVTFPAVNTSPSLLVPPCDVYFDKGGKDIDNARRPKVVTPFPQIEITRKENGTDMQVQATTDEDVKEDLLLEVDLVTVGEQSEKGDASPSQDNSQNKENEPVTAEREGAAAAKQTDPTLHTVSCSTHQHEIKEEEEEAIIERNKNGSKAIISVEREREKGEVSREESEQTRQNDCEILYEKAALDSVSNYNQVDSHQVQITAKTSAQKDVAASALETVDQDSSANEQIRQENNDWERDQSPGIVLEKVVTSALNSANKEKNQAQDFENESQDIKVEESIADSTQGVSRCQSAPRRDIRAVLVKEETPQRGEHICWNIEPNSSSSSPAMETTDSAVAAQNCSSSQCLFYPVKEEEREVIVGAVESTTPTSSEVNCTLEHCTADEAFAPQEVTSQPGLDLTDGQVAGAEVEEQTAPNLRDILLRGSDEEDCTFEWSDSHVDSEEEIMTNFYKKQSALTNQSDVSVTTVQDRSGNNMTKKPVDYFSKYFNWDTWREISNCTNTLNNLSSPVTVEEIAQFVGIHIAMGSLKFPSPRLYWEDLTRVPLVADAMPLTRFLELSRILKLACPQANQQTSSNSRKEGLIGFSNASNNRHYGDLQHCKSVNSDPLWKIQHVLERFVKGCRSLGRLGDYAIDQYPLPLTTRSHTSKHSLHCTTLVNFDGMVLDLDLKLDFSDKEGVAEKMPPKGSMVFLCKQELSTPAMLERLLAAGIHSAGQVGGAKGQIGDEFVSSDGKLLLRRAHCGFILSTIGNGQRNMSSLIDSFEKAQISAHLNKDLQTLYSIPPAFFSPSCWPQTVLWYLTDLALVNSWLLYRQDAKHLDTPLTLLSFRLEVSKALTLASGLDMQDSLANQTEDAHSPSDGQNPSLLHKSSLPDAATRYDGSGHWPEQLAEGEGGRCRFGDCQRTSRVLCLKCCVFLCISRNHNCFINFHSQGHQAK